MDKIKELEEEIEECNHNGCKGTTHQTHLIIELKSMKAERTRILKIIDGDDYMNLKELKEKINEKS